MYICIVCILASCSDTCHSWDIKMRCQKCCPSMLSTSRKATKLKQRNTGNLKFSFQVKII